MEELADLELIGPETSKLIFALESLQPRLDSLVSSNSLSSPSPFFLLLAEMRQVCESPAEIESPREAVRILLSAGLSHKEVKSAVWGRAELARHLSDRAVCSGAVDRLADFGFCRSVAAFSQLFDGKGFETLDELLATSLLSPAQLRAVRRLIETAPNRPAFGQELVDLRLETLPFEAVFSPFRGVLFLLVDFQLSACKNPRLVLGNLDWLYRQYRAAELPSRPAALRELLTFPLAPSEALKSTQPAHLHQKIAVFRLLSVPTPQLEALCGLAALRSALEVPSGTSPGVPFGAPSGTFGTSGVMSALRAGLSPSDFRAWLKTCDGQVFSASEIAEICEALDGPSESVALKLLAGILERGGANADAVKQMTPELRPRLWGVSLEALALARRVERLLPPPEQPEPPRGFLDLRDLVD